MDFSLVTIFTTVSECRDLRFLALRGVDFVFSSGGGEGVAGCVTEIAAMTGDEGGGGLDMGAADVVLRRGSGEGAADSLVLLLD